MRSRRKALIVAAVILFTLLFAGVGVVLVRGFMAFSRAETALNTTEGRLDYLYGCNPFPSERNLEAEKRNLATLDRELSDLLGALRRGQVEAMEQSPAKFVAQFWEVRASMLARADAAGVAVLGKKDFDFGFRRQMDGGLPAPKDVARLTQQLRIVQDMVGVLCAARIVELRGLGREEFEVEAVQGGAMRPADEPPAVGRRRRSAEAPTVAAMNAVNVEAGSIPGGQMFGAWHFSFSFVANESALIRVLDGFARNPLFTVVSKMELTGDSRMNAKPAEVTAPPTGGVAKGAVPPAPAPGGVASRDARIVCGRDTPVSVKMEVDVYQFANQAGASARAEGAP